MVLSLPTRLFKLDVEAIRKAPDHFDFKSSIGTLCDQTVLANLKSCSYCAVSHVWGTTTDIEVNGITWNVPVFSAEKLLFILRACEERGYEYIWFDVLCIDQTEGGPERSTEAAHMQRYYTEAHATIVFGAEFGQFWSKWGQVDEILRRWTKNGGRESAISVENADLGRVDEFIKEGWFWRVWTLQEAVIPLTTSPSDTVVTNPAPYNRARLITSNGMPMDLRALCDYIDWTYVALAKLDYVESSAKYSWIHPGGGVVNDNGWWMLATLRAAIGLGAAKLHPLQALSMTLYRGVSPTYLATYLKGIYGLIDEEWRIQIKIPVDEPNKNEQYELEELWKAMSIKYVEKKEAEVLLLRTAVNDVWDTARTWAAGVRPAEFYSGAFLPKYGDGAVTEATVEGDSLKLKASESKILDVVGETPYHDGSGQLLRLINDLTQNSSDISSIVTLLEFAASKAGLTLQGFDSFKSLPIHTANALSSGLRGFFVGWDRWIITLDVDGVAKKKAYLAWFPYRDSDPKVRLSNCSVLRLRDNGNEWGVLVKRETIVQGKPPSYRKVGVVFLHSTTALTDKKEIVIL